MAATKIWDVLGLRLHIDYVIIIGIRSGPHRASIVNVSVYDRNIYQRLCYTSLRIELYGGSLQSR